MKGTGKLILTYFLVCAAASAGWEIGLLVVVNGKEIKESIKGKIRNLVGIKKENKTKHDSELES